MNILIVDDQISVIKGITTGINFSQLGIHHVYTATNVAQAKEIIKANVIDILISDIEMPNENGLSLCKWSFDNHPHMICILLTSHASFTYAKEALKFGCFDYIIQPAPYHEIEDVILRAIAKIMSDREKNHYYNLEVTGNIVLNLFSQNPSNRQNSILSLNQMGYSISEDSHIQSVIIEIYPYTKSESPTFSDKSIYLSLIEKAKMSFHSPTINPLVCLNRYKQFVLLLLCNDESLQEVGMESFNLFYENLCKELGPDISCYITPQGLLSESREVIYAGHQLLINNVTKKPGIYLSKRDKTIPKSTGILENITRWTKLLESSQFSILEENILSYLEFNAFINRLNLENLSEFHQQLTKIFFVYSYQMNIDIMNLFSVKFTYSDYMNSYKDVRSLTECISYIIHAIKDNSSADVAKGDVQRAIEYILANISNAISVKDVANYVHLSPEYFSKLFKKEMGENVKNYILRIKVDVAKDLLENPNIPISMVATELGYNNFSHFTQMFKKHEDVTPSEYRNRILNHDKE